VLTNAQIVEKVDAELARIVRDERVRWAALDADLDVAFGEIERLVLAGGKRLRPLFCYWGWVAAGGDPNSDEPIRIGSAIELLHVFALFHDDIMDGASTRRGEPTTHVSMEKQHVSAQWAGDARRFGDGAAILIGDLTYVMSDRTMGNISPEAREMWHEMRLEVNVGQYLDVMGSARRERRPEYADRICRFKSAKYTIERPLHIGALAANVGRGESLMPVLSDYGLPLGDAFQMRDDVLGAFGEPEVTGKPVGDDLREGKPTPLLARAYQSALSAQREVLDLVGNVHMSDDIVRSIQRVIEETGALEAMEELISSLREQAQAVLDDPLIHQDAVMALHELAVQVTQRIV
jgi:geranylgeranyl diphosphate synthase type I